MKIMKTFFLPLIALLLIVSKDIAMAADGKSVVEQNRCGGCHNMSGPPAKSIADVLNKKAPDLFYSGSKFQEKFLVEFLQKPYRLRPAGTVYVNNVKPGKEIDEIQDPLLCASKLSKEDAEASSKYLMTLKDLNMKTGIYKAKSEFFKTRAKLIFFKSGACNACHQVSIGGKAKGGLSGPVLYNAGARLNGDWVLSYIKDPHYWDPKVWMPKNDVPDATLLLLTNFVMFMEKLGGDNE